MKFLLTRRAIFDLEKIYKYSREHWGEKQSDEYLDKLYEVFHFLAGNPELGKIWQHRAAPFYMFPAGSHFVVYDLIDDQVIIITILHGKQNIEKFVEYMKPEFLLDIEEIKRNL